MHSELDDVVTSARNGKRIAPQTVLIDAKTANEFLAMRADPRRFIPAIFEGQWADAEKKATPGEILIVAAVACTEDVVRVLGRQNGRLYALTRASQGNSSKRRRSKK